MTAVFNNNDSSVNPSRRLALRAGAGLAAGLVLPVGLTRAAEVSKTIEQRIVVAEAVETYNFEQWKRIYLSEMHLPHQGATNTCVLHQLQSAQFALGRPLVSAQEFTRVHGKFENADLPEAFNTFGLPPSAFRLREEDFHPSRIPGAIRPAKPVLGTPYAELTPEQMVERGINMGNIVVMAVELNVLHRAFQRKYFPAKTDYKPASGSHAIRVIGLKKSSRNVIESAFIYDSSSPTSETRYEIGFSDLMQAYRNGSWNSFVNSSVYVTKATVFLPLIESY